MEIKFTVIAVYMVFIFLISGCSSANPYSDKFSEQKVELSTHKLTTYSIIKNSKYLVVFESGLGDDGSIWQQKKVAEKIAEKSDVLVYDRGGYGKSTVNNEPRNIANLGLELEQVISKNANGRKVVLVGHSLGGMIIREYAVKHSNEVAGILFLDPSHESYNKPTQKEEDDIYNICKEHFGINHGATLEARELIEDSQYMATLADLPNVPVVVITNLKDHTESDKKLWYDAHEKLKSGVADFTHITTDKSGHYIMIFEPDLVIGEINKLLLKIN